MARLVFDALGPFGAVHLRAPGTSGAALLRLAESLAPMQDDSGCRLIINDRPDVAAAARAWGVQLTQRSLSVRDARAFPSPLALGASIHSLHEASVQVTEGADWLMAGNIYETDTHPGRTALGAAFVRDVAALGTPVIAIGGVLPHHVPALRAAGARGVAAIRGIWDAADPAKAAAAYL